MIDGKWKNGTPRASPILMDSTGYNVPSPHSRPVRIVGGVIAPTINRHVGLVVPYLYTGRSDAHTPRTVARGTGHGAGSSLLQAGVSRQWYRYKCHMQCHMQRQALTSANRRCKASHRSASCALPTACPPVTTMSHTPSSVNWSVNKALSPLSML